MTKLWAIKIRVSLVPINFYHKTMHILYLNWSLYSFQLKKLSLLTDWVTVNAEKTRLDTLRPPTHLRKRIVTYFIRDLLTAVLKDGMFVFRDTLFLDVLICGTVVDVYSRGNYHHIKGRIATVGTQYHHHAVI